MADKQEEISMSEKSFLFPIISSNSCEKSSATQTRSLFPSVFVPDTKEKESLDWLSNASYNVQAGVSSTLEEQEHESASSHSSNEEEILKVEKSEQTEEKRDRKRRKKDKSRKHKKHKHKKHKKSIDDPKLTKLPSTIWIEESGLEIEKAFRIHRKPDYGNREFGGLYRLDIALHNQNPKLKCLGLTKEQEIEQKSKGKEKKKSSQRYWEGCVSSGEVLSFDSTKKSGFGFSSNFSYVPLELPTAVNEENESSTVEKEKPVSELLSKTRELNQKVRQNPNDIQSWLALADLQARQVESSNLTTDSLNRSALEKQKKSCKLSMEKKAAVLEQAVQKNPSCVDLIIAYMNVCSEAMSSEAILEKWKRFMFTQPQKTLLWKNYLMFCQSSFSAFSFSTTLEVYTKCFTTLSAIQSGKFISHSPDKDIESGVLEIFVQFCQFLRQSGQMEKAIAAFQALIEFNFFSPKSLEEEHSLTSFFETFWDSEVPRFGEENAPGWSNWMEDQPKTSHNIPLSEIFPSSNTHDKNSTQEKIISSHSEKPGTWLKLETSREAEQWRPKKTSDDEDENEDPDRIVLFQDISFVLFKISDEKRKFQLLAYFLSFLGIDIHSSSVNLETFLPVLLEDEEQLTSFVDDGHHQSLACGWSYFQNPEDAQQTDISHRTSVRNIFNQSLECFSEDLQAILATHWLNFEKNIFMSEVNPKQRKQCYKAVRKLAKSLLKLEQHRNNLKLWIAFIEIEWENGNLEETRRIVCSVLEQLQNVTDETSVTRYYHFVRLYCEVEMGLENGNERNKKATNLEGRRNRILPAIFVVVNKACSSVQAILTPAQILKTHKALQEQGTLMLTDLQSWDFGIVDDERKDFLVDFMICYALFQYWSLGIDAAKSVLDSMLSAASSERIQDESIRSPDLNDQQDAFVKFSGSKHHEDVLVFYCKLLQFHSRNNICPVKPLRDLLLSSLSTFPESAFFLHSYVRLELRSCTSYSVRRYFDSVLARSKTPVPWLFVILYERQRQKTYQSVTRSPLEPTVSQEIKESSDPVIQLPQTGVLHRLRSLYERAIHHSSARHCVAIWRSYMKFEAEIGDLRQAKAIFYQSLQSCAWAKIIYLEAIRIFPELFQDVYDMMEDKELRIRTPLEELDLLLET